MDLNHVPELRALNNQQQANSFNWRGQFEVIQPPSGLNLSESTEHGQDTPISDQRTQEVPLHQTPMQWTMPIESGHKDCGNIDMGHDTMPEIPGFYYKEGHVYLESRNPAQIENRYIKEKDWTVTQQQHIGVGASGIVWEATDRRSEASLAVKEYKNKTEIPSECPPGLDQFKMNRLLYIREFNLLQLQIRERSKFLQTINIWSQLNHKNIGQFYGASMERTSPTDNMRLYTFSRPYQGGTLQQLITKYGRFNETMSIEFTLQIVSMIVYLHGKHYMHRDIKPANIVIEYCFERVNLRLIDFDHAVAIPRGTLKDKSYSAGTVAYASPELALRLPYDSKTDIWSLGVCIHQMATGQLLWNILVGDHASIRGKLQRYKEKGIPPPLPRLIKGDLRKFLGKCLAVNPQQRPNVIQLAALLQSKGTMKSIYTVAPADPLESMDIAEPADPLEPMDTT